MQLLPGYWTVKVFQVIIWAEGREMTNCFTRVKEKMLRLDHKQSLEIVPQLGKINYKFSKLLHARGVAIAWGLGA